MLDKTTYTLPTLQGSLDLPLPTTRVIDGKYIGMNRTWCPSERGTLAAGWHLGLVQVDPSIVQAAKLFAVSTALVHRKVEELTNRGCIPVLPLVDAFARASKSERQAAARMIGVSVVWDEMISPLI
jgi:hypothetical protein